MRPIKHDAIQNDLRLMEMALYEVTKGQTQHATHEDIIKKVAEYKGIIKRGTYTIDQLEDKIFSRFGIIDERSVTDTAIYDASPDMGANYDPIASLFSGLFRKSQGLPNYPPASPSASVPPTTNNVPPEIDEDLMEELDKFEEKFQQDQLDVDFPEGKDRKPEEDDEEDPDDDQY